MVSRFQVSCRLGTYQVCTLGAPCVHNILSSSQEQPRPTCLLTSPYPPPLPPNPTVPLMPLSPLTAKFSQLCVFVLPVAHAL